MAEVKDAQAAYGAPAVAPGSHDEYIQETPLWVVVVRGLQMLFSFIILAMCGYLIHGKALDANVFALVVCLMTWVVVAYTLVSEKVPDAHKLYNIWAVLALDLLMAIFWLSSMGANAALRASFIYDVNVKNCYNDGSAVNSNHCTIFKRDLEKRAAVAGTAGLAVMSAIAGLSALMLIFFIATLVFHGRTFRMYHQSKSGTVSDNGTTEMTAQQTPMLASQQAPVPTHGTYTEYASQTQPQAYPQAQPQGYPAQSAFASPAQQYPSPATQYPSPAQQYPSQVQPQGYPQAYPPTTPSPAPMSVPSPAPYELNSPHSLPHQQTPYQHPGSEPYGAYPGPGQAQHQQQYHSPHGTPAPGQPYYPPTQQ